MKDRKTKPALRVAHCNDRAQIKRVLAGSGQALLPMLELLEGAQASIDELMHDTALALVEQLLVLSAQELAGAKQRGRDGGDVLWHGAQRGVVALAERQLRVQRPRLRDKTGREVPVPAYERLRDDASIGVRVRDILVAGVSTRRYAQVLPEAAGPVVRRARRHARDSGPRRRDAAGRGAAGRGAGHRGRGGRQGYVVHPAPRAVRRSGA